MQQDANLSTEEVMMNEDEDTTDSRWRNHVLRSREKKSRFEEIERQRDVFNDAHIATTRYIESLKLHIRLLTERVSELEGEEE